MLVSENDLPAPAASNLLSVAHQKPPISDDKLKHLYAAMLKMRLLDERLRGRQKASRFKSCFQEASEVGCTIDLRPEDAIVVSEPQRFVAVMRGLPSVIPNRIFGLAQTCLQGEQAFSLRVFQNRSAAERLTLATGIALGYRMEGKDSVVVAFSDTDGFAGARASLHLAFEYRLPVIYVQQEAGIGSSRRFDNAHQPPLVPVDQSDVIAVYRVAYEAVDKARRGVGPTVIQCVRHGRSGKPTRSTSSEDPIEHMEGQLRKKNLWAEELKRGVEEGFLEELGFPRVVHKHRNSFVRCANNNSQPTS